MKTDYQQDIRAFYAEQKRAHEAERFWRRVVYGIALVAGGFSVYCYWTFGG